MTYVTLAVVGFALAYWFGLLPQLTPASKPAAPLFPSAPKPISVVSTSAELFAQAYAQARLEAEAQLAHDHAAQALAAAKAVFTAPFSPAPSVPQEPPVAAKA